LDIRKIKEGLKTKTNVGQNVKFVGWKREATYSIDLLVNRVSFFINMSKVYIIVQIALLGKLFIPSLILPNQVCANYEKGESTNAKNDGIDDPWNTVSFLECV
jgi:hypothetical protein